MVKVRMAAVCRWFDDLRATLKWYAKYRVWSPPTRRWEGPGGSPRWPLPARRPRRR